VSDTLGLDPVTCASCEYRYPSSEQICPMCGTEPLRPLVARNKSSRGRYEVRPSGEDTQKRPFMLGLRQGLWRLKIPVVVVLIAGMAVAALFYKRSKPLAAKESGAAAKFSGAKFSGTKLSGASGQLKPETAGERDIAPDAAGGVQQRDVAGPETAQAIDKAKENDAGARLSARSAATSAATSEQVKIENAAERQIVRPPVARVQHLAPAKVGTTPIARAAEDDPVELWKAVKRGSVNAELVLAKLYLEGEAVPQNCEQAHMLLRAASTKGSKAADNLLKSRYAERCE
jgi:hypothetical protein